MLAKSVTVGQDFLRIHFAFYSSMKNTFRIPVYKGTSMYINLCAKYQIQMVQNTQNTRFTYFANINQFGSNIR